MADNVTLPAMGTGETNPVAATDEVTYSGDTANVQLVRIVQVTGSEGAKTVVDLPGEATNGLDVDVTRLPALVAGSANIGDVDVLTVPTDPFGANADASSATGSLSAKLRYLATLLKLEDDAHNSADPGVMALAVAKATPALLGADGDYSPVQLDGSGRLWVRPAPVQTRISVTPTITAGAYGSGDCLGGLMTFANAARVSGGSGIVQSICVLDKTQAQRAAMDLLFFDRSVTVAGDNNPVATSDGDMANCLGVVQIGPYNSAWPGTPLNSFASLFNVGLPFVLNGTDLFVQAVVRATPTYTSTTDLVFILTILQD